MRRVRPTLRTLKDLGMGFPPLTGSLSAIDHPVLNKAQEIPDLHDAGSVQRIVSISDRPIFKVKIDPWRAAATLVVTPCEVSDEINVQPDAEVWWTIAAGNRKGDTPSQDFYGRLEKECQRAAKGTPAKVNSDGLLPKEVDYKRMSAEFATIAVENIRHIVREVICRSAQTGTRWSHEVAGHIITAKVKTEEGETYLAITAEGFVDPSALAIILDSVPGVPKEDWAAEPGEVLGIRPQKDQMVFSTILPPEVLAALLDEHDKNHL